MDVITVSGELAAECAEAINVLARATANITAISQSKIPKTLDGLRGAVTSMEHELSVSRPALEVLRRVLMQVLPTSAGQAAAQVLAKAIENYEAHELLAAHMRAAIDTGPNDTLVS